MLEALIRTKDSVGLDKRRGDVICVKLKEFADWGSMEIRVHQPVNWIDDELESRMKKELKKTGLPPTSITPYKESEEVKFSDESGEIFAKTEVTKTRSKKYFDFDSILDTNLKNKIFENEEAVYLEEFHIKSKTEEQINLEFMSNKKLMRTEMLKNTPSDNTYRLTAHEDEINALRSMLHILELDGKDTTYINSKINSIISRSTDG